LGVFALALGVYVATMGPTIDFWDCGEFITTSHIVGVPHQPGTPLYVLVGRIFDIVFGSADLESPSLRTAWAVNFMSGFFSALAVMFVYLIVLRVARRADPDAGWLAHAGGVTGALFLIFSTTFWNNAIEAEVYGLAAFNMTCLTWLTLRWYETCQERRSDQLLLLIVYLLGLGVGFHLGSLLVYPGIFLLILLARNRQLPLIDLLVMSCGLGLFLFSTITRNNNLLWLLLLVYVGFVVVRTLSGRRFVLWGSLLFLLGLSVHLIMLIRAGAVPEPAINQTDPDTFGTLMQVLRREQYPPIDPFVRRAPLVWQFQYYYNFFIEQFSFLSSGSARLMYIATFIGPVFLGLLGVFHGIRRAWPVFLMLLSHYIVNGELLTLYLNFTDHEVRERDYFYFAAFLFFAVFIGIGVSALLRYAAGPEGKTVAQLAEGEKVVPVRAGWLAKLAAVMLIAIAALPLIQPGHSKWFEHDRSDNRIAYEYAYNILAGLDQNAVLFTNGDNDTFPIWYLQEVERFRRDVTVVNLSLINLAWYTKQLRSREPPLSLTYSDAQVDQLEARLIENPETGERFLIYVRDYVVEDIIVTNLQSATPRPVFFAVTIPQDNMQRYFSHLQMEGLAYRLTSTPGPEGYPKTDAQRLLDNMLGKYEYDALLTGNSQQRRAKYDELKGQQLDAGPATRLEIEGVEPVIDYEEVFEQIGRNRYDVFRNRNTVHLLGNYPAALVRAGFEMIVQARETALEDSVSYDRAMWQALAAFELATRFEPYYDQVAEFYPLLLVDRGKNTEALEYLVDMRGHVGQQLEESTTYESITGMVRVGAPEPAVAWVEARLQDSPRRKFYYELAFKVYQLLGRLDDCESVIERWRQISGQTDQAMSEALRTLRQRALENEDERQREELENIR